MATRITVTEVLPGSNANADKGHGLLLTNGHWLEKAGQTLASSWKFIGEVQPLNESGKRRNMHPSMAHLNGVGVPELNRPEVCWPREQVWAQLLGIGCQQHLNGGPQVLICCTHMLRAHKSSIFTTACLRTGLY